MSDMSDGHGRELTGRHVLLIVLAFFGTIIAVNVFMATKAVGTFPGLEAKNGFVESQVFQQKRAAQEALGWDVSAVLEDGVLAISFTDAGGGPAAVATLDAVVGRPTHVQEDRQPEFTHQGGTFRTPMALEPGNWDVRIAAVASDGTEFRRRVALEVR